MTIELTTEQAVYLKLLIGVFTEGAETMVLKEIAKALAPVAFTIQRGDF